jgi:hypothetical protein
MHALVAQEAVLWSAGGFASAHCFEFRSIQEIRDRVDLMYRLGDPYVPRYLGSPAELDAGEVAVLHAAAEDVRDACGDTITAAKEDMEGDPLPRYTALIAHEEPLHQAALRMLERLGPAS